MKTKKIKQASELEIGKYYRDDDNYYYVTGRTEAPQGSFLNALSFVAGSEFLDLETPYIEEIVKDGNFEEINRDLFMNAFEHFKEEKKKIILLEMESLALANLKLKNITL